jgi:hypothetical protein
VVGLLLGTLVCAQFMISVEVLAMMGIAVAVGVVVTAVLSWPRARDVFPYVVQALAVAVGVAVVVLAWPSWYLLAGPRHISGVPFQGVQGVANGRLFHLWSAGASSVAVPIPGSASGVVVGAPGDFVGFGVVLVALVSLVVARRRKVAWVMAIVALACIVLSWGPTLWITSTHAVSGPWLPWRTLAKLPIFRNILPVRFAIFTDLAVAVLIAVGIDTARTWPVWGRLDRSAGLARRPGRHDRSPTDEERSVAPVGVVFTVLSCLVAALVLVPQWVNYQVPIATQRVVLPAWFATVGRTVRPGSTVLTYPFPMSSTVVSQPMVWQAVDGMRFRLAGGYVKVPRPDGRPLTTGAPGSALRLLFDLTTGAAARPGSAQLQSLRSAVRGWGVSWIVVTSSGPEPEQTAAVFTAVMGRLPTVTHDAWVWNVAADPPTSGTSGPAAARALEGCTHPTGQVVSDRGGTLTQSTNQCVLDQLARPPGAP